MEQSEQERWPRCKCGGVAVDNASGDITRTCIRCGAIVKPKMAITAITCGPQGECGCKCPDGPCDHVWGDEPKEVGTGAWSVVCVRCGMSSLDHSLWVGP